MAPNSTTEDMGTLSAQNCTQVGALAGFKAAAIACLASAIPTLAAVRTIPWAKTNLNYTAQALIIGGASTAAFFINSEKTILAGKRKNVGY